MSDYSLGGTERFNPYYVPPSAPAGLQQAAPAMRGYETQAGPYAQSAYGQQVSERGYYDMAQSWYAGANREAVGNGWDTNFWKRARAQEDKATYDGTLATRFEDKLATGVVTWDHTGTNGETYRFGDVYNNGKWQANLYDQFDTPTADLMMSDLLVPGKTKQQIFESPDRVDLLHEEVENARKTNQENYRDFAAATRFDRQVERREDGYSNWVDAAITAAGAIGGAVVTGGLAGAIAGTVGGPIGTGTGAIVGGIGGGIGAFLNRDELTEHAARVQEINERAWESMGTQATGTVLTNWAGFAGRTAISPVSNIVRGSYDALEGETGDGESAYMHSPAVAAKQTKWEAAGGGPGILWQGLDLVATAADSVLQFASAPARVAYMGQVGAMATGKVGELTFGEGEQWDPSTQEFTNVYRDENGDFDATRAAAGWGSVAIDVVQMGTVPGLAKMAQSARAAVKGPDEAVEGAASAWAKKQVDSATPGSASTYAAGTAAPTVRKETVGGWTYSLDQAGNAVTRRPSLSILAPSEQIGALEAGAVAMRTAAKAKGALSADDFYRAATEVATGRRKISVALVTAMGEGYEEGVQAFLDKHSTGAEVWDVTNWEEIGRSALYGFAGGAGLGVAVAASLPTTDQRLKAQARVGYALRTGGQYLSDEEWSGYDEVQKRQMAAWNSMENSVIQAAHAKVIKDQAHTVNGGVQAAHFLLDAVNRAKTADLMRQSPRTDGSFLVTQIESAGRVDADGNLLPGAMPDDAVVASGRQTLINLTQHMKGVALQITKLIEERDAARAANIATPSATLQAQEAHLEAQLGQALLVDKHGRDLLEAVERTVLRMYDPGATRHSIEIDAEVLNTYLRELYNEVDDPNGSPVRNSPEIKRALAQAVSLRYTRDPQDQAGSYPILLPQISAQLTLANADNQVEISHAILPAIRGDHDGDKLRQLNQIVLDAEAWTALRIGSGYLGAGRSVNVKTPQYEEAIFEYLVKAISSPNPTMQAYADGTLDKIKNAIRNRYAGVIDTAKLEPALTLFTEAVRAQDKDARQVLLDTLAEDAGAELTAFARGERPGQNVTGMSNEWLWINGLIRSSLQEFQQNYAGLTKPPSRPTKRTDDPHGQVPTARQRRLVHGATVGNTVGLLLSGATPNRQAQKLHYSKLTAAVLSANWTNPSTTDILALAQLYEALGSNLSQSELDRVRAVDDITARAYARLKRLSNEASQLHPDLDKNEAIPVLANLRVRDFEITEKGDVRLKQGEITLAQLLLRQSLAQDRRDKQLIWDASPELQAKHAKLGAYTRPSTQGVRGSSPVNAQNAFVAVAGAQQMVTLLGEDSNLFGPHLTLEQFVRSYNAMSEERKRETDRQLKQQGPYGTRKSKQNMPYGLKETVAGAVTPYRAVVDSVIAVGHDRLSINTDMVNAPPDKEHLNGELAKKGYRTGRKFRAAHKAARTAIFQRLELDPRTSQLNIDYVQRMLEQHPDFASSLFTLIPQDSVQAAFSQVGDQTFVSRWVVEMLTISNPVEAEMHYWRNLLLAEWNALGRGETRSDDSDDEANTNLRDFHDLKRRMHQVMFRLAARPDGGMLYEEFRKQLVDAQDLEQFMRWVNTHPGVRGDMAPLVAWVDDVAEFDMDKAQGGWSTGLRGTALREAIEGYQRHSSNLVDTFREEQSSINDDVNTTLAIERAMKFRTGSTTAVLEQGDEQLLDNLVTAISRAEDLSFQAGPMAMVYQTAGSAGGYYPQAHTKGDNPPVYDLIGQFDTVRDAFDYVTNYERVMAKLTSINLTAVGNQMGLVAKDGGRTMDDDGREVTWDMPKGPDGLPTLPAVQAILDMLKDPNTRPMVRAMLYPQVLERDPDGVMRMKQVIGKSLTELLDGTSHKQLFNDHGRLKRKQAMRYVSLLEAEATREGGRFEVQRLANELVVARTSGATQVLSYEDQLAMSMQAYADIAQAVTTIATTAARPRHKGVDPLEELRKETKDALRQFALATRVGLDPREINFNKAREQAEALVVDILADRETEMVQDHNRILAAAAEAGRRGDTAEQNRQIQRGVEVRQDFEDFEERMNLLLSDDFTQQVIQMYGYPVDPQKDPRLTAMKQRVLTTYVKENLTLLDQASAAPLVLRKLLLQIQDSGRRGALPELLDKEWDLLGRSVISVYLDQAMSTGHTEVSPYPDAKHAQDQRYFDTTFGFLADNLLDTNSPLIKGAIRIHHQAGRSAMPAVAQTEMLKTLSQTVFDQSKFGRWTSDIPRALVEANLRLDTAAAAMAMALAGNSPKRQAIISAATQRTYEVPPDELLSGISLSWVDLHKEPYDEVTVGLATNVAGQVLPVQRPLAQLNNRFATKVEMTVPGVADPVDLLAYDRNLGRPFVPHQGPVNMTLQEVHLERIKAVVRRWCEQSQVNPYTVGIQMEFFHPDSQPDGPEWFNNLYFEGTSFRLDADQSRSLNETIWFKFNAINQIVQATAMDSFKSGTPAYKAVPLPEDVDRQGLEVDWATDFTGMLRAKTKMLMESDMGFGFLDVEYFNAVYKNMKLRHFVRGIDPLLQEPTLWSAEEVIAWQLANPGAKAEDFPLESPALWVPTDDVLRSMLGEQGTQGVQRLTPDVLELDLHAVDQYRGVTPEMRSQFAPGVSGETVQLKDTRVAGRSRQTVLEIKTPATRKELAARDLLLRRMELERQDIIKERSAVRTAAEEGKFHPGRNMKTVLDRGADMLELENLPFDWGSMKVSYIGARKPRDVRSSKRQLYELETLLTSDGSRGGWIYREGSEANPPMGLLNAKSLNRLSGALRLARGDVVLVETDSFNGDMKLIEKRMRFFADKGVTLLLSGGAATDDRAMAASILASELEYVSVAGSKHLYAPEDTMSRYQNLRARESTLLQRQTISRRNRLAIFQVRDKDIDESSAWVDFDNPSLGAVGVTMDLMPFNYLAGFNVPVDAFSNTNQLEDARRRILAMDTPEGRAKLFALSNGEFTRAGRTKPQLRLKARNRDEVETLRLARERFDLDFAELVSRIQTHPGVLPPTGETFGTGNLVPLVDSFGRILLYRHGHRAPTRAEVDAMTKDGSSNDFAIYSVRPEPAATTHTGTVVRWSPRAGYGLQLELNIDLQTLGAKKVLEWNGMKHTLVPRPPTIRLPRFGLFDKVRQGIDMIVAMADYASKESNEGTVQNHRNAFAFFGIDFTDDVARYFRTTPAKALDILHAIATQAPRISIGTADELITMRQLDESFLYQIASIPPQVDNSVQPTWAERLHEPTVEAQIVRAMMIYLSTSEAKVSDILRSGGLNDPTSSIDSVSELMPRLFTKAFDRAPIGSKLRTEMFARFNAQLPARRQSGEGYSLSQGWDFTVHNANPEDNMTGRLQFAEVHDSGDNPVKNGMAFEEFGEQALQQHSIDIAYQSIGATPSYRRGLVKAKERAAPTHIHRFAETDLTDGGAYRFFHEVDLSTSSDLRQQTPAEIQYQRDAREVVNQCRRRIKTDDHHGWTKPQRDKARKRSLDIIHRMNLKDSQVYVVDYWLRESLGMPFGIDKDGNEVGNVTGAQALQALEDIYWLVDRGYLPTVGGMIPLMHVHDLQMIYRANRNRSDAWRPKVSASRTSTEVAEQWDDWVSISLGSAFTSDDLFDPLYLMALDGHMHTYQNSVNDRFNARDLLDLPVSLDQLQTAKMWDPELNRLLLSIDPNKDLLFRGPVVLDTARATVEELMGGRRIWGRLEAQVAPASEIAKRREHIRRWRKENGIPLPVDTTMWNFRKNGAELMHLSTSTNALMRTLLNLRVGMAMFNPALWVSMGPEQWIRGMLDWSANTITGQGTAGVVAKGQAYVTEKVRKAAVGTEDQDPSAFAQLVEHMDMGHRYTPRQLKRLDDLYENMGKHPTFKSMVYHDLFYLRPHEHAVGRVEKVASGFARWGTSMQDPTRGIFAKTLARRYVDGALQHIAMTPTLGIIPVDHLISHLRTDPEWLKKHHPDAHQAASNAVAQIRSLKSTVLNETIKGVVDPLSTHHNFFVNNASNLLLKMPLVFSGYTMNVVTSLLGLQGMDQMTAMFLHGRTNGFKHPRTLMGRVQAKLAGREIHPDDTANFDMSSVLEGVDLSRAFIRGGLTHTGLFMAGLLAQGLGLSGEDDEERRKRLLALQQGGFAHTLDARRIENDFRNADAIFLDWLPPQLEQWFTVTDASAPGGKRAMVEPHWILRQFISPMMGMERFFNTGDFRNVVWGFGDALGAFPIINTSMWLDMVETSRELGEMAMQEAELGGPAHLATSAGLLTSIVGGYERMLLENAFINELYIGFDRFDRDPYKLPLRDSDGDLQVDIEGVAREQELSVEQYITENRDKLTREIKGGKWEGQLYLDPETGDIAQGYQTRDDLSARMHVLTENRASLGLFMNLFTGLNPGDADYFRYQMAPKIREIEKPRVSRDAAEAFIRAAMQGQGGLPNLDADELAQKMKNYYMDADIWVDFGAIDRAAAAAVAAGTGGTGIPAPLSVLDKEGREHLTELGSRAVMTGLWKGSVQLDHASLSGIYIPYEMREKIQKEWLNELVQEGVDMGLDITKAQSRRDRLWYGPTDDPSVKGIGDILWSKDISYEDTAKYHQLNTTYLMGPDGKPWATGVTRQGFFGALGIRPFQRYMVSEADNMSTDMRLNSVDLVNGMNTGLRGLELIHDSRYVPTDVEIGESIRKAIEESNKQNFTRQPPTTSTGGGGNYGYGGGYYGFGGGYGGGGYGGGGYSGGGGSSYFSKMYALPEGQAPYGNSIPFINTSNPLIRREDIRRERVWSERGRLKQWQ